MGKVAAEEGREQPLTHHSVSVTSEQSHCPLIRCGCGRILRHIGLRCVLVLILSVAGFLSAVFWLPPFLNLGDQRDLDLDSRFRGHDIVASFYVGKPVSLLNDNILQLKDDISGEMNAPNIKVVILFLEPVPGQNVSKVFFAVDPDADSQRISVAAQSLIRASFSTLVSRQLSLRLTASLFGDPFSFEVMKFHGGITVIPPQSAYLLQKVQIYFNFTLNYSIEQIQDSFYELTSQLKSGLHLSPYENLYISLSNLRGSTVDAPTIVQSSVLLAIGAQPSIPRLKQLAQTIKGNSHSRNLGLNNTTFGKVKQVRLSSILQNSLNGSDGGGGPLPSPSPMPYPHHHHHHLHHHHHHHHHSYDPPFGPTMPPTPATHEGNSPTWRKNSPAPLPSSHAREKHSHSHSPAPSITYEAKPPRSPSPAPSITYEVKPPRSHSPAPSIIYEAKPPRSHSPAPSSTHEAKPPGCRYRQKRSSGPAPGHPHVTPTASPAFSPKKSVAPLPPPKRKPPPPPSRSSTVQGPLPHAAFGQVQPPSKSKSDSALSISPSPSSRAYTCTSQLFPLRWAFLLFVVLVLHP